MTQAASPATIFEYAGDEDVVRVFTEHPDTARKLERFGYQPVEIHTRGGEPVSWVYKIPRSVFRWRVDVRPTRAPRPQ